MVSFVGFLECESGGEGKSWDGEKASERPGFLESGGDGGNRSREGGEEGRKGEKLRSQTKSMKKTKRGSVIVGSRIAGVHCVE